MSRSWAFSNSRIPKVKSCSRFFDSVPLSDRDSLKRWVTCENQVRTPIKKVLSNQPTRLGILCTRALLGCGQLWLLPIGSEDPVWIDAKR
jgi:hypothetical protein